MRWTAQGLEYEADQRHAEIVVKAMRLETASGVNTPGTKGTVAVSVMSAELSTRYRHRIVLPQHTRPHVHHSLLYLVLSTL